MPYNRMIINHVLLHDVIGVVYGGTLRSFGKMSYNDKPSAPLLPNGESSDPLGCVQHERSGEDFSGVETGLVAISANS